MKRVLSAFLLLSTLLFVHFVRSGAPVNASPEGDLKKLTADKEDVASLTQAYRIYKDQILKNPQNYDLRVQADDVVYYLVDQISDKAQKKAYLADGIEWAQQAISLKPDDPAGHFYYGVLTGLKAQVSGVFTALKIKNTIRDEMEKVIQLDPHYSHGDAYEALGDWYSDVPSIMGGNDEKGKKYFMKALEIAPNCAKPHLGLAKLYMGHLKYDLAKKEIQLVLSSPSENDICAFENKRDQADAQELLKKIEDRLSTPLRGYQKR